MQILQRKQEALQAGRRPGYQADDQQTKEAGDALGNGTKVEEVSNYGANTGAKACGDEWLTKRQGNCVHKRLADAEHTNWDGLGEVLLDALVLGLEEDCKTSTKPGRRLPSSAEEAGS